MNRYVMLFLVALLGAAVSLPAQFRQNRRSTNSRGQVAVVKPSIRGHVGQRATVRSSHGRHGERSRSVRSSYRNRGRSLRGSRSVRQHGRWEVRCERVLVPGFWQWQDTPAVYGWIYDSCGNQHWGVVQPACRQRVWVPPRWETRSRRVWVRC